MSWVKVKVLQPTHIEKGWALISAWSLSSRDIWHTEIEWCSEGARTSLSRQISLMQALSQAWLSFLSQLQIIIAFCRISRGTVLLVLRQHVTSPVMTSVNLISPFVWFPKAGLTSSLMYFEPMLPLKYRKSKWISFFALFIIRARSYEAALSLKSKVSYMISSSSYSQKG